VAPGPAERRPDPLNRPTLGVAVTHDANALLAQYRRRRRPHITVLADAYGDGELGRLVRTLESLTQPRSSPSVPNQPAPAAASIRMSCPRSGSGPRARG